MMFANSTINSGVNREEAEKILVSFLKDESLKVLAVKGRWGVGKTHLVQTVLKSNSEQFYYSSVFGVSSLEQLKAQILVNNHGKSYDLKRPRNIISKLLDWNNKNSQQVAKVPKLTDFPVSGAIISIAGDLLLNLLFGSIKNTIICIDDIERKSSSLQLDELLGFIDYLVQESSSKIVLIYNEERLFQNESSKKDLENYREKVIDIEVLLEPTVEENISLVFGDNSDTKIIQDALRATSTKNIRIFRKVQWALSHIRSLANEWHPSLQTQLIRNIVVLALAKYDTEFPIKLEEVVRYVDSLSHSNISQDFLDEAVKISIILNNFGYERLEFDKQIIKFLETSSFNRQEFIDQGNALNEMEKTQHILEKFRELWTPYSDSFGRNEREIAENITRFLQTHCLNLPIQEFEKLENLASAVEVDISSYKKALLEQIILSTEDIRSLTSLRKKASAFPNLIKHVDKKVFAHMEQLSIAEVLTRITEKSGWSQEEAEFIDSRTVDDYYQWLQGEIPDLYLLVRQCLSMGTSGSENLKNAIIELAGESKLNAMRAKFLYNITVDGDGEAAI